MKNIFSNFNFKRIFKAFSLTEKILFGVFALVLVATGLRLAQNFNNKFLVTVPEDGGKLNEGVIGVPRLINPILAVSETDRDLTALIYSGLMRATPEGLISDLAESYSVSEDLMTYNFKIRENAVFHDSKPVTADDVLFTIINAQNPEIKSPKRSNWEGVVIEKISDRELSFHLKKPYPPFLQNMTLGILPKHIWNQIDVSEFSLSSFNLEPIGSGPYKLNSIAKDSIGIPKSYTLIPFKRFTLGKAHIAEINIFFAKNQTDLLSLYDAGDISAVHGISPSIAKEYSNEDKRIESVTLPRVFGIFFNQDEAQVLSSSAVRKALDMATPRQSVVDNTLSGFGKIINGTIPHNVLEQTISGELSQDQKITEAIKILENAGWKKNDAGVMELVSKTDKKVLSFSISTGNFPELITAAQTVIAEWKKIGAEVELKIYEQSDLNVNAIRPRKYDALLFGLVIGRDLDFYAFWHSSQRNDPGLNISKYANITADKILEEIRETNDAQALKEKFTALNAEISKDTPAVFLYSPNFIYILPKNIKGFEIKDMVTAEERFLNIHKWFIYTNKVWKIFIKN